MDRMNGLFGVVVGLVVVLLVVLAGWFVFVSPERSKSAQLDTQVGAAETELASDQALLAAPRAKKTEVALQMARRALPADPQVSNILRQLASLAQQSRTELDGVTPAAATPVTGGEAIPITLAFKGRYFGLQSLLRLLRQSAHVKGDSLVATGRLYTVQSIQFAGGAPGGDITATIQLNAYVYGGTPSATGTPATATTTSSATAAAPTN
jgi:hypothetical protein